ncbi:MAG: nuclear transport factor 2 family protein [Bilifractor sp.]|jgi:hypothetical protein
MDEQEQIKECYRQMYQGMVTKDESILREALNPSFELIHMTGMRQPLNTFIQAIQDGTLNYSSARHQNIKVQVQGDRAELIGQSLVRAAVFGGSWYTWRLQLDCSLVRHDGRWQIAQARASTY